MRMLGGLAALATLGFAGPAMAQDASLGWLVGEWCTTPAPGEKVTCERWRPMVSGVMEGQTIVHHQRFHTVEAMRITQGGMGLVFHAEPQGQPPADFHAAAAQGNAVRFENRAHDYPQVVRYWREGEVLMAEISLADGSKPQRWTYHRKS